MARSKLPLLDAVNHACVDEVIWGHRLREDQAAWLLVLEMLNVAQACLCSEAADPLPDMGRPDTPAVSSPLRVRFRNLLFRFNQKAAELAARVQANLCSSGEAWVRWLEYVTQEYDAPGGADYSALRERFDDFEQFERGLDLVRSTAIGGLDEQKGIYNRFIFPMAADALYWETGIKNDGGQKILDPTYNSFTRAGTLLHIMLARSSSAPALRTQLKAFLERDSQARRLLRHLQVEESADSSHRRDIARTYLPYASHPRFDLLGEDCNHILSLQAPDNDKLLWLVPLSALHLSIYHAEVASEEYLCGILPLPLVCEIVAPRKTVVRQESMESLSENGDFARRAVDAFLQQAFRSSAWTTIVEARDTPIAERLEQACAFVRSTFRPQKFNTEELKASGQIDVIRDDTIRYFRDRHAREFSRVHFTYGREAGLVSRRATNRYRYAPTDQLLQSLVVANVLDERPLEDFLDSLFQRYGMVIGPRQQRALEETGRAELAKTVSGEAFRHNQTRLESRLKSMGMLRRLSDSQAYVLNPLQPRLL